MFCISCKLVIRYGSLLRFWFEFVGKGCRQVYITGGVVSFLSDHRKRNTMLHCPAVSDIDIDQWVQVLSGSFSIIKLQFHNQWVLLAPTDDCCLTPLFHKMLQNSGHLFQHPSGLISCNSLQRTYPEVQATCMFLYTQIFCSFLSFLCCKQHTL